jgi:hypothetical protein
MKFQVRLFSNQQKTNTIAFSQKLKIISQDEFYSIVLMLCFSNINIIDELDILNLIVMNLKIFNI